jgi:hypothetical protein
MLCPLAAICDKYSSVACEINPPEKCGFYTFFMNIVNAKNHEECEDCDRDCSTCGIRFEKEYDWRY